MSIIKAGLSSTIFATLSCEDAMARTAALGLQGIEWSADSHLPHGDLETAERLMMGTLRAGLTISGYGSQYRIGLADRSDDPRQSFKAVLDTARWLQAPLIRIWAHRTRPSGLLSRAKLYSQILHIADQAGKLGICLAIEPHPKSFVASYEVLLDIVEMARHPYVRCCWAPLRDEGSEKISKTLGAKTAMIHCRHLRHLGVIEALKKPFIPVFTEVHHRSRETTLDYWMILDHSGTDSEEGLRDEAECLKTLIREGPESSSLLGNNRAGTCGTGAEPSGTGTGDQRQAVQTKPRSVPV